MDKIVLYGLGMRFEKLVRKNYLVNKELKKYEIVGFIDKKRVGENILFNNVNYVIFSLNTWMDFNIDKVVIISNKYLDEIESELVKRGFREEQIFTLDEILKPLFYDFIHIDCYQGKEGIEIGGPSNVFSNIYNVCKKCDNINFSLITTWWVGEKSDKYVFKNRTLGEIYILDATNLTNIADDTYDFVLTSNCLEHIANPIKALKELHRIMKKGGRIIIVVPKKDASFDHNRQFTSFEHLLKDFENNDVISLKF